MSHKAPFAWAKKIAPALLEADEIPLFGKSPPLDLERLTSLLASRFGKPNFSLQVLDQKWREEENLLSGLGPRPHVIALTLSPLETPLYWIMGQTDLKKLTSSLFSGKTPLLASPLKEGFYRYLLLQALDTLQGIEPLSAFSLELLEEPPALSGPSFCFDVELSIDGLSCLGRAALPAALRTAWSQTFEKRPAPFAPSEKMRQIELPLTLEVGFAHLSPPEWRALEKGDLLLLEQGSFHPKKKKGLATCTLQGTPLFHAKIEQNKIELLEYAFHYEAPMQSKNPSPLENLPLKVSVELAELKITLDQLMRLTPGNFLELPLAADRSVSLVLNGDKVGRGELIEMGESFGVRILEIGSR